MDSRASRIKNIAKFCRLDILQFHGSETPEFCAKFKNYRVVKAFRVKSAIDKAEVRKYKTYGYLFDSYIKSCPGGTGRSFNWKLLRNIRGARKQIFLSGGLSPENVPAAVKAVRPDWVDASSLLEERPGKKDKAKVKKFVQAAKKVAL